MMWIIFVVLLFGLTCRPVAADTIAPLEAGVDSGVLLMAVTGEVTEIKPTTAMVPCEIVNRDRFVTVRVEYSEDSRSWKRSNYKKIKQFRREFVRIKLDKLSPGTKYFYRVYAEGEVGASLGSVYWFVTK